MKKFLIRTFGVLGIVYLIVCSLLFLQQENFIFFPRKLPRDYQFTFNGNFEERMIRTGDGTLLHGLLFTVQHSKGLVFYLHGNAGSLDSWGEIAETYTNLNHDIFILDYRGYGKSEGKISSEEQFYEDVQTAYENLKMEYEENTIIIAGYSIGTGAAARLASLNNPRMLILKAPYYSLKDLMKRFYPIIPTFILKYKFNTYKYVEQTDAPIVIFHGNADRIVYYGSSLKLEKHLKPEDKIITLEGQGHNGINDNPVFRKELQKLISD